jgi:sugar phosphate isomerase/epimerase
MEPITRRSFIQKSAIAASSIPFLTFPDWPLAGGAKDEALSVHIFSKHLQFLDYRRTGQVAAELGFDGVDLTVRPKGHVLPESVKTDLPKAIQEIQAGGSQCKMITTRVENVKSQLDVDVLETAASSGVKYYRMNWYKFPKGKSMPDALLLYQKQIQKLSKLNRQLGLIGCYQNHAGRDVGGSFWEIHQILEKADPGHFGTQYDIRHAMAEGGFSWENGFQLLQPTIQTIVLKDFYWKKDAGKWKITNCPIGDGMVDFDKYFKLLKAHDMHPPVSLHLEYPLGGAENGLSEISVDEKVVFDAMKKDLESVQRLWKMA